jgi:hypothetical protein
MNDKGLKSMKLASRHVKRNLPTKSLLTKEVVLNLLKSMPYIPEYVLRT